MKSMQLTIYIGRDIMNKKIAILVGVIVFAVVSVFSVNTLFQEDSTK